MTYYVNMNDAMMSGWGGATGGRSIFVVECANIDQARAIEKAATEFKEMKRVDISSKPRKGRLGDHVSIKPYSDMGEAWTKYASHFGKQ